ncbi:probable serine/threonine-protein kinase roco4 [Mytilus californianus]|uniref:probable serine/threonine-protein kinase roco4 n=1 Tax=Mytilus californianus TaxID=6549 RepID=UPI002247A994|nr:probable serine/threonine-protein kinase roco4 [Mytilus californianus]
MNAILVEVKKDQDRMTSESLVECGFWDFAGQKDYYATHQTFLNPHAIYLLVTNISEDIAATEDDKNFDSIEEYIDFWFDSIHCLRTSSTGHGLYPPVIVVCTHIDEYKTNKEYMGQM